MKIERDISTYENKPSSVLPSTDVLKHEDTAGWMPSDLSPLLRVIPERSRLRVGAPLLDKVLFAFSNTDLKPAIMLYGLNGNPSHVGDIYRRVAPVLSDLWDSHSQPQNIARIVKTFMSRPGFAYEPAPNYFATTSQGESTARDSAAFLLRKAVDLEVPFGPILQERTENTENPTRAYITRIATLMALKEGALSQVRLYEKIGGDLSVLSWNLKVLSERKLISYNAVDPEVKGQYVYQRADMARASSAGTLAKNIIKYFELNETGNNYTIAKAIGRRDIHNIGKTLKQLTRDGVLKPVKWEATVHQSDAEIKQLGKRFIDEVIVPLLEAYSGDGQALQVLAQARTELEQNPAIVTLALDQYKKQRVLTPEPETQQSILVLIQENGPQRRNQIISLIGKNAHPQLIELVTSGQLKTVRDGNASFYVLPEANDKPIRSGEVILFEFNPPADLIESPNHRLNEEYRHEPNRKVRDGYRRELDTVEFWKKLHKELLKVPVDRHTARDFFLKHDPQYEDWPKRWYSGIFSNHIRALWSLGIEKPWEFIQAYESDGASQELQKSILAAQELIKRVFPVETGQRIFNRRYMDRLETSEFWNELMIDAKNAPPGTKIESFLLRFDPEVEGKMKPAYQHGKYYNLRAMVRKHTDDNLVALLTSYRSAQNAPLQDQLTVREAQAALRQWLVVKNAPEDNFSDIAELKKRIEVGENERKRQLDRLKELKVHFDRFGNFDEQDLAVLTQCDAARAQELLRNIRGSDYDEVSFASMGVSMTRREDREDIPVPFPVEPRAAFLVYLFDSWRKGNPLPAISKHNDDLIFSNGIIRGSLKTMGKYLSHYETELKKQNPKATFNAQPLLDSILKYINNFKDNLT